MANFPRHIEDHSDEARATQARQLRLTTALFSVKLQASKDALALSLSLTAPPPRAAVELEAAPVPCPA